MVQRIVFLVVVFLNVSLVISKAHSEVLTSEIVKEKVLKNNRHIQASSRISSAVEDRKGYLLRSYFPRVETQAGIETFTKEFRKESNDPFYGIEASINLFRAFKDYEKEKQVQSEVKAVQAESDEVYLDELGKAQEAFWSVVYARESLSILDKYQELNRKNMASARQRISAGVAPRTDLVEFEMNDKLLSQEKLRFEVLMSTSEHRLRILMNEPKEKKYSFPDRIPADVDEKGTKGSLNSLGLSSVRKTEALAAKSRSESSVAAKWWMPELDLITGYKQMNRRESEEFLQRDRQDYYYGIRVRMNLFDAAQSLTEQQALAALAIAGEYKAEQTQRELEVEFENQQKQLQNLATQVRDAQSNQDMMKNYLESILREYGRGVKGSSEVLSASDRFYEYQKKFIELKKDYQLMRFRLSETVEEK